MRARGIALLCLVSFAIGSGGALCWIYYGPTGRAFADAIDAERRAIGYIERAKGDSGRLGETILGAKRAIDGGGSIPDRLRLLASRIDAIRAEWNRLDQGLDEALPGATP